MYVYIHMSIVVITKRRTLQPQWNVHLAFKTNSCWSGTVYSQHLLAVCNFPFSCEYWQQITDVFHKLIFSSLFRTLFHKASLILLLEGDRREWGVVAEPVSVCLGLSTVKTEAFPVGYRQMGLSQCLLFLQSFLQHVVSLHSPR